MSNCSNNYYSFVVVQCKFREERHACGKQAKYMVHWTTPSEDEENTPVCITHKIAFETSETNQLFPYKILSIEPINPKLVVLK